MVVLLEREGGGRYADMCIPVDILMCIPIHVSLSPGRDTRITRDMCIPIGTHKTREPSIKSLLPSYLWGHTRDIYTTRHPGDAFVSVTGELLRETRCPRSFSAMETSANQTIARLQKC